MDLSGWILSRWKNPCQPCLSVRLCCFQHIQWEWGRAFVFVLQLYRLGPERQQITFFKSGDWKGSCNSFNKYFARLICIRSHCVHQILQQYLHSSWKNISLMKQIQSQFTDLGGGWGSEHRGSMKVISDGLKIIPPWLGLRYHQPKMLSPGVSWWWMAGVAYWRLLWGIQSHDGVVVVTFHILLPGSRAVSRQYKPWCHKDNDKNLSHPFCNHRICGLAKRCIMLNYNFFRITRRHGSAGDNDSELRPSLRVSPTLNMKVSPRPQFITLAR